MSGDRNEPRSNPIGKAPMAACRHLCRRESDADDDVCTEKKRHTDVPSRRGTTRSLSDPVDETVSVAASSAHRIDTSTPFPPVVMDAGVEATAYSRSDIGGAAPSATPTRIDLWAGFAAPCVAPFAGRPPLGNGWAVEVGDERLVGTLVGRRVGGTDDRGGGAGRRRGR